MANLTYKQALVDTIKTSRAKIKKVDAKVENLRQVFDQDAYVVNTETTEGTATMPSGTLKYGTLDKVIGKTVKDETLTNRAVVKGKTFKYNQLNNNLGSDYSVSGVEFTRNSDKSWKVVGTSTASIYKALSNNYINLVNTHKYAIFANTSDVANVTIHIPAFSGSVGSSNAKLSGAIKTYTPATNQDSRVYLNIEAIGVSVNFSRLIVQVVDLTDLYEAGNEPTTIEQFLTDYPMYNDFVEFTEGSLKSVTFDEFTYAGENLLDYEKHFVNGNIYVVYKGNGLFEDIRDGLYAAFVNVTLPKGTYTAYTVGDGLSYIRIFNEINGNKYETFTLNETTTFNIRVRVTGSNKTFKIGIVKGSAVPTEWKQYNGQTITFSQPQELNGLDTQDELYSYVEGNELVTKKIKRYGKFTIEASNLIDVSSSGGRNIKRCRTDIIKSDAFTILTDDQVVKGIASKKYDIIRTGSYWAYDRTITVQSNESCYIHDNSLGTLEQFKALCPIEIVYLLAEPIVEEVSRVPLTCDFTKVENVLVDAETELEKGVVVGNEIEKVDVVGANIWNEEWEVGTISTTEGTNISSTIKIRSKNFIKTIGNATYYFYSNIAGDGDYTYFYDENKKFIGVKWLGVWNVSITSPQDARYMKFIRQGTTYNHDIAIIKGTNGTYSPHKHQTLLESKMPLIKERVGDTSLGYIDLKRRVFVPTLAKINLGDLNYETNGTLGQTGFIRTNDITNIEAHSTTIISNDYTQITSMTTSTSDDKSYCIYGDGNFRIRDNSLPNLKALVQYLKGVFLYYKPVTPIEIDLSDILTEDDGLISILEEGATISPSNEDVSIEYTIERKL